MSFDADALFRLLPAIHRIRDAELAASIQDLLTPAEAKELLALEALPNATVAEQERLESLREKARRGPLKALAMAIADVIAPVEENLAQLYDDLFIETCADWVIPYIGDLIGYEPLHALGRARGLARAEVAHTIALRRRKGTAAVLEQLARDVTGWNARAVEYFQLLGATQHMNHLRLHSRYAPALRDWEALARIDSAFETVAHTIDVRRIDSRRGRFNIPNVGIFLWRIGAHRHTRNPALRVDDRRYLVSPLGHPLQLYSNPRPEEEIAHLAEPSNVPEPITRRMLREYKPLYYGTATRTGDADSSIVLYADGTEVPRDAIVACNLADDGAGWAHAPLDGVSLTRRPDGTIVEEPLADKYGIDPVLGRITLGKDVPLPKALHVTYHYGFPAALGGGEYSRERQPDAPGTKVLRIPADHASVQAALSALDGDGVVEIQDSGRYEETLSVKVRSGAQVTLRAAENCRPTLILEGPLLVSTLITSTPNTRSGGTFNLEGVLMAGDCLKVPRQAGSEISRVRIAHATLVPGLALDEVGAPVSKGAANLLVELPGVSIELDHAIIGSIRVAELASLVAKDSIIDATDPTLPAYAAMQGGTPDASSPAGELSLEACTVIGRIHAVSVGLISNSLLLAHAAAGEPPIRIERRQTGCVRFSFLPFASLVPRRFRCQPQSDSESRVVPHFVSLRYGLASYCQLTRNTPDEIRLGASDESEMGAFHELFSPQREANLQARLREYLRTGLFSGIFYAS